MENNLEKIFNIINKCRKKIFIFFITFVMLFLVVFNYSSYLLEFICNPLLPQKTTSGLIYYPKSELKYLIYTTPLEIIWVKTKITLISTLIILVPMILWILLKDFDFFRRKKYLFYSLFSIAYILFYLGIWFSLFLFIPFLINFFLNYQSEYLYAFWTVNNYTDLVINITVLSGVIFEFPLIIFALVWLKILNIEKIITSRKYIIILIFIIAALITPGPDVVFQLLVAIPLWLIFEVTILFLKLIDKKESI